MLLLQICSARGASPATVAGQLNAVRKTCEDHGKEIIKLQRGKQAYGSTCRV
jgi:hypothetical protein